LELERKFLVKVEQTEARGMRKLQRWCYSNPMPVQVQDPSYYYVGYPNDQSFNIQPEYKYPQQYPPVQNFIKTERSNVLIRKENKKVDSKSVLQEEHQDTKRTKTSNEKEASDLLLNFFNVANNNVDSTNTESCLDSSMSSTTTTIKSDASGSDAGTTSQGDEDDSSGQNKEDSDGSNGVIHIFPTTSQQTASARAQYEQNHRRPMKFSPKSQQLQYVSYGGYEEYPDETVSDNSSGSSGQDLLEVSQQQQQLQQPQYYQHHPSQPGLPPAYYQPHHVQSGGQMYMWQPPAVNPNNATIVSRNSYPMTYTSIPPPSLPHSPVRSHTQAQYAYLQQQQFQHHQQQWLQLRQPPQMMYYPTSQVINNSNNLISQPSRKRQYE